MSYSSIAVTTSHRSALASQKRAFTPCNKHLSLHRASSIRCQATGQEQQAQAKISNPAFNVTSAEDRVRLRSEAEAPWRSVRLTLFGFSAVSASVGLLVSIPQLIGALGGAPNALPLADVGTNIAVNSGAAALFAWLCVRDWQARGRQMARLTREEALAGCRLQLANGKTLALGALRGAARVVICAGTPEQVSASLASAEPYKAELVRRGVLVVALPIYEGEGGQGGSVEPPAREDLRWRATAVELGAWREWFTQQLSLSTKATSDRGLYVSLRKDGRVRGSGMGQPPWAALAAQLPPEEGIWTGLLDGMDGRV